jgi:hypothetical protein
VWALVIDVLIWNAVVDVIVVSCLVLSKSKRLKRH